jgi:branched-chain amino acid transport system substrate-binding protein
VSTLDTYAEVEITPKTVPFVKAFKARYKKSPTYNAATYDAIMLLKDTIEKEGTTNADKLVAAIEKTEHVGTAATATWDKKHDLVWAVGKTSGIAVQWQDGKKVPFWPPQVKGMQPFKMPAK